MQQEMKNPEDICEKHIFKAQFPCIIEEKIDFANSVS